MEQAGFDFLILLIVLGVTYYAVLFLIDWSVSRAFWKTVKDKQKGQR
jgi:hypothetical protein